MIDKETPVERMSWAIILKPLTASIPLYPLSSPIKNEESIPSLSVFVHSPCLNSSFVHQEFVVIEMRPKISEIDPRPIAENWKNYAKVYFNYF